MNIQQALTIMATGRTERQETWSYDEIRDAMLFLRDEIDRINETESNADDLITWIDTGDYYGTETIEGLAAEWAELNAEAGR